MFGDIGTNLRNFKAYRQTYRAPRYAMKVPDLDGYLTALALSQQKLSDREWIEAVFSMPDPWFVDNEEAKQVFADIHELAALHLHWTSEANWMPKPKLVRQIDGSLDSAEWCQGFMQAVSEDPAKWQPVTDHALDSMLTISDKCLDLDGRNLSGGNFDPNCTALFGYQFFEFTEHLKTIHAVMREHREPARPNYNFGFDRTSAKPARKWSFSKTIKNAFIGDPDEHPAISQQACAAGKETGA